MKIQSIDKEIINILETGYYRIPRFQRPYSWDKDNVLDFWEDSIAENSSDYFIGSFVVYKNDSVYGVVDGQQRLTTITMLLSALRNAFSKQGFSSQANGVHKLIEKSDLNDNKQYVLQTETSYPYFQEFIQKFGEPEIEEVIRDEEKNLKNAYDIISKKINSSIEAIRIDSTIEADSKTELIQKKLEEIRDKILKLKVIYIELDDENDAYIVFETLNTRGKELRPSDLVKNHFTRLIKVKNKGVDLPRDKWN